MLIAPAWFKSVFGKGVKRAGTGVARVGERVMRPGGGRYKNMTHMNNYFFQN